MITLLMKFARRSAIATAMLITLFSSLAQAEEDTVKVGILHSLSGTMAISETSLRDVLLFAIDEINANGGVMGEQIEPVGLATLCRKSQATPRARQGSSRFRLLDFR